MAFDIIEEANKLARSQAHISIAEDGGVIIENTSGTGEEIALMAAVLLAKDTIDRATSAMDSSGFQVREVAISFAAATAFSAFEQRFMAALRAMAEEDKQDENSSNDK